DFYRSEHQKRKDEICPFSSLAFLQPTTVDKEPAKRALKSSSVNEGKKLFIRFFQLLEIKLSM
ncbi:hypothetical protein, partial [Streptococcus pneumoniae]|uniref:hypothetical protein n=1 Tax=Streptococcus pneumoniae TaxID=1313 RepID=UPI001C5A830A